MGQTASNLGRKNIHIDESSASKRTSSPPHFIRELSHTSLSDVQDSAAQKMQCQKDHARMPIPRRRSSLTAIHLDASHFGQPPDLLDILGYHAGTYSETVGPPRSVRNLTTRSEAFDVDHKGTRQLLSARNFSEPLVVNVRSIPATDYSRYLNGIYLPKTILSKDYEISAPALTKVHRQCYVGHRSMPSNPNKICPVSCMTCHITDGDTRSKCTWCGLTMCAECMTEFEQRSRNLNDFLHWMANKDARSDSQYSTVDSKGVDVTQLEEG